MAQQATISDTTLIENVRNGDEASFEEIVHKYETKVYNLAMRLTRNTCDAEEVLQDVFITVYRKLDSFEGKAKFSSWLYRITANAAFMKLRKRRQDQSVPIEDMLPYIQNTISTAWTQSAIAGDSQAVNNEMRIALEGAIAKLPSEYRAVFVLRDIDCLSNKEVGDILGLSIPAIKSRLHRSRLMLRKKLKMFFEDYTSDEKVVAVGPRLVNKAA